MRGECRDVSPQDFISNEPTPRLDSSSANPAWLTSLPRSHTAAVTVTSLTSLPRAGAHAYATISYCSIAIPDENRPQGKGFQTPMPKYLGNLATR